MVGIVMAAPSLLQLPGGGEIVLDDLDDVLPADAPSPAISSSATPM
jgi:hypothetical protein